MAIKITPFKFQPFSKKQLQVLTWWLPNSPVKEKDIIIADGSVRSGKTVSMSLSYIQWSMQRFDGENLGMAGKTIGSFRRNVLNPLKRMLKALKYRVVEHRSENMVEIRIGKRTNYYYIFGGKDESSQDLIQGITLAGMLFDEVVLMPKSFVNQATARCSIDGAKLWFNCNPEGPRHWFKLEYINKAIGKDIKAEDRLNAVYLHFTMDDNLSLTESVKARYYRQYTGVFYRRFILGQWAVAAGAIYDMFDEGRHIVKRIPKDYEKLWVACDYGAGNPTVFLLQGLKKNIYYTLREYYYDSRKDGNLSKADIQYSEDLDQFLNDNEDIVQGEDIPIIVDPSAKNFINQLRNDGFTVHKAKNDVIEGIRYLSSLIAAGRFLIHESCKITIQQIMSYIWDPKKQDRGEDAPVKRDDHTCDAARYGAFYHKGPDALADTFSADNI